MKNGIDKVAGDIIDGVSGISDFVVKEPEPEPIEPEPDKSAGLNRKPETGKTDKYGNSFNPEIHQVNKDGTPRINRKDGFISMKAGKWNRTYKERPKSKIGRIPGSEPEGKPEPETIKETFKSGLTPQMAGKVAADHTFLIGMMLGGDEWRPMKDESIGLDEAAFLTTAYANYFESMGITDIPPGWMLVIALSGYVLPRLTMPKTQTRLSRLTGWIKRKTGRVFKRGARSDIRHDGERKDDTSKDDKPET